MSSNDIAIRISNLGKCYQIYDTPRDRLKQFVAPRLQRLFGQSPKQYFREFWALKDVSFEVKKGETVGIIGRNGSGKSTILQSICGILTPTIGKVETNGRISALLELGSGFNPEFTGRENVYMNAALLGLSRDEIDNRFDDIASFADIGEFIEQPIKTYSSGMFVRLAFAVAVTVDPDILIVDEALSVGDIRFQLKCHRKFEEFREKNKTILFVSHSTSDVVRLCNRAIWLDNGMIRKSGISKNVVEEYHAWMVHDTGLQQAIVAMTDALKNKGNEYDLVPVPVNACITGEGGATVDAVGFFTEDNKRITLLDGPKNVKIVFRVNAKVMIDNPYVGFHIINIKGLRIIGSNNHVLGQEMARIDAGDTVLVNFSFLFPEIENGTYFVALGVNDGTMQTHIRHQYIADAYEFQFNSMSLLQRQAVLFKLNHCSVDVSSCC
ncbi:MAG: ABC transporter ATP-binding protein [Smithellaceae bacterium]|jgi:lipopolysaccharide transport system ATP-binding protein